MRVWSQLRNAPISPFLSVNLISLSFPGDVRFIPRTFETKHYIYFFGTEVNPQYSYINTMTRQSYSSFMLRICKNDTGANYTAQADGEEIKKQRSHLPAYFAFWNGIDRKTHVDETVFSYSAHAWGDIYHLPTKIFTSAIKFPFGCYLKRYDGAQSLNAFWGEQNILYFNRLGKFNNFLPILDDRCVKKVS